MTRIEIIANKSVEDDVVERLEAAVPGFMYTVVPVAQGRGRQARRLGTATWPEENFILIAYLDEGGAEAAKAAILGLKARYPTEGIKFFELKGA